MLRLTLAQMRRSMGRLAAAGIAIVIGTAFVAATLLAGNLITRSTYDAIAAQYGEADLVVAAPASAELTTAQLEGVATTPGVAAAGGQLLSYQAMTDGGSRTIYQGVIPTTSDPRLMPLTVTEGRMPSAAGEVALPPDVAERLRTEVGGTVDVQRTVPVDDGESWEDRSEQLTVTGLVEDPKNAYGVLGGAAVMDAATLAGWESDAQGAPVTYRQVAVVLADGASLETVRAALAAGVGSAVDVVTPQEQAAATAKEMTGGQDMFFLVFVLTFAAIALVVAGLVISNTFQVLVAQRARTLALLRAVGANKRQVGASVITEAAILGVAASLTGVAVGAGLGQVALWVAGNGPAAVFLPDSITLTWQVVVLPVLVGTAVTVAAASVPARVATRVAPLAALRPAEAPTSEKGSAGRVRLVLSLLAVVGGLALLAGGAVLGTVAQNPQLGLLAGVAGGAVSFVGVTVSAVFWLPKVTALAGRAVAASGPTARLAAANTLRNPRRTAATSTALLIGVTLVAMMSTGAASARHSLADQLEGMYPVDVYVTAEGSADDSRGAAVPAGIADAVGSVAGVASVAQPQMALATLEGKRFDDEGSVVAGEPSSPDDEVQVALAGIEPAEAEAALTDDSYVQHLEPGTVVVPSGQASFYGVSDGDTVEVRGAGGTTALTVSVAPNDRINELLVVPQDLATVEPNPLVTTLWVALEGDDTSAVGRIQDLVADTGETLGVQGGAVERASFESVVDTALGMVLGLLAVAVIIALIGVANTLSLSVIERRRESATLRAVGVTRGQLRWMLAVEGMLIAGVGAVLGILLGLLYGWGGSLAALGVMGDVRLAVPWTEILLIAVVALVAGLVASVLPGRSAAKSSPVAALGAD
ncbi:ABC transporter permease [Xylanimonas oleitrophica]|uniref:ABC transporter permease n=1 Tax=Xylanimonas oleitrophica TaxID=2607479 RepID=A0A2W5X269_9MICO|nr:ABC transporter permease [Xylanimonas oleitrophica]PZR54425.1 ABC transporter permease [Xylanimonas oleitrophica]